MLHFPQVTSVCGPRREARVQERLSRLGLGPLKLAPEALGD